LEEIRISPIGAVKTLVDDIYGMPMEGEKAKVCVPEQVKSKRR